MTVLTGSRSVLRASLLWAASVLLTLICFTYQDRTGPTYPLEGDVRSPRGFLHFKFQRSETIGTDLKVVLAAPLPDSLSAVVRFRRFKSNDNWSSMALTQGTFEFSRRGHSETVRGLGAELPSLKERAGKYEYFVVVNDGSGGWFSITGDKPVYARYKADVPTWALIIHIVVIFASMTLAIRTTFEAIMNGKFLRMLWATVVSFLTGAFVLGPLVQWYAFGVWWSGVPFGYDWTDNKVLVELAFWILALVLNRGGRRNRWSVYLAGMATVVVYLIPHSIFGSEYDYTTGGGQGTAG